MPALLMSARFSEPLNLGTIEALIADTKAAAAANAVFSESELKRALDSISSLGGHGIDQLQLCKLLESAAHRPHKDWLLTEAAAKEMQNIFVGPSSQEFRRIFLRVLNDGNWDGAVAAAAARPTECKPWGKLTSLNTLSVVSS